MQKENKLKGDNMANPYGNNGFNRLNQQQQRQPGYGQPQQPQGYGQPTYGQPQGFGQPQGYGQPAMDPRVAQQQQMMQQQMIQQQMMQQQMMQRQPQGYGQPVMDPRVAQQQMMQRQPAYGQPQGFGQPAYGQPGYGQPQGFGQPQTPSTAPISSMIDNVTPNLNNNQTQKEVRVEPTKPVCDNLSPADGSEFAPYYDKSTEKLVKVINEETCTYTWKIEKI